MHGAPAHLHSLHSFLIPTAIARFPCRIHSIHTASLKKIFIPPPPTRTAGTMSQLPYSSSSSTKSANWTSHRDPSRVGSGGSYHGKKESQSQGDTRSYGPSSSLRPSTTSSGQSVYYNEATRTFNPTNPIRAITPSYMEKAQEKPETLAVPQKLLVILDLNGTLFYRAKRNNRAVTSRPYLTPFLDFLFGHCQVMVWSSSQPHSVDAMLSFGFGPQQSKLDRVWTRKHFRLPQVDYDRKVLTIKDLEFVWEGIEQEKTASIGGHVEPSSSAHVEFDQTNTVLIDDSTAKIQLQPYNGLALKDFDEDLVRAGTDNELLRVRRYLEKLIYQKNVSAYMRLHPYRSDYPLDEAAAKEVNDKRPSKGQDELAGALDDLTRRFAKKTV